MNNQLPGQKAIRAVIFDLGGVILRTDDPKPRTSLAEQMGKTRMQLEDAVFANPTSQRAEKGLASVEEVWETVGKILNLRSEEIPSFRSQFFGGDHVDFRLIELLRALRPTYRTALLSNGWLQDLPKFLKEDLQIPEDTFDVVISSARQGAAKPDPAIYQAVLDQLGVAAHEAVFVDDNDLNIEGARKAGLHGIRFYHPEQARQELFQYVHLQ